MAKIIKYKKCTFCKKSKKVSQFYPSSSMKLGLSSRCKTCTKKVSTQYSKTHRSEIREKDKINRKARKLEYISKMPESPRPYIAGSIVDDKISTKACILRLAYEYLIYKQYDAFKVLEKLCEDKKLLKDFYEISKKEKFVFPKKTMRFITESWEEKLYNDLKDIKEYRLANFIYA